MKEKYLFVEVKEDSEQPVFLIANPYPLYGRIDNIFEAKDVIYDFTGSFCI